MTLLTDLFIRQVKPGTKPQKYTDEKGLFLLVAPAGGKWRRLAYRYDGKQKQLSLGTYPDVTLKDARIGATQHASCSSIAKPELQSLVALQPICVASACKKRSSITIWITSGFTP